MGTVKENVINLVKKYVGLLELVFALSKKVGDGKTFFRTVLT